MNLSTYKTLPALLRAAISATHPLARDAAVARHVGVTPYTLYRWMDGSSVPKPVTLTEVLVRLSVTDRDILTYALDLRAAAVVTKKAERTSKKVS